LKIHKKLFFKKVSYAGLGAAPQLLPPRGLGQRPNFSPLASPRAAARLFLIKEHLFFKNIFSFGALSVII
jgi:hypothetical protein